MFLISTMCVATRANPAAHRLHFRGTQILGFNTLSKFSTSSNKPLEMVMTSPKIETDIAWNELIASWNIGLPSDAYLKIEVRGIYPDHETRYYTLAIWSTDPMNYPRESVLHQKDIDGDVLTDTMVLKRPCTKLQVRLTLGGREAEKAKFNFLGLCLTDTRDEYAVLPSNQAAWGKTIDVPERSQMAYPDGKELCSPTSLSMLMTYWSIRLKRPELSKDVPEIVKAVYDSNWPGTGNWSFNMAYAGSFAGVRAYVTRLSDISELEDWIAAGIPVALSVCYNKLRGFDGASSGHLVVCVGFTQKGDPIINDPGTSQNVRKTFTRNNLIKAWAHSKNASYLIYPKDSKAPKDRFSHWDSVPAP